MGEQIEWTSQLTEDMIDLIIESRSLEEVAKMLSQKHGMRITKNMVSGKWSRFVKQRFGGAQ